MAIQFIEEDFVGVRDQATSSGKPDVTLVFGDAVEVVPDTTNSHPGFTELKLLNHGDGTRTGFVKGAPPLRNGGVLKLSMVDVQQGDGLILETPAGKIVFIDGGDNKLFARHAAWRYLHRQSSPTSPLEVDALLITHGDADHFDGLNDLRRSEELPAKKANKRLFIHPKRVFHNGLVKSPAKVGGSTVPDDERFGRTVQDGNDLLAIDLFDDPRDAAPAAQGGAFKRWAASLDHWQQRGPIDVKRVAFGMDEGTLFDFLHQEGITIELQGPFTQMTTDPATNQQVPALPYFNRPKKSAVLHLEQGTAGEGSPSASHTINGHSITFRMTFGNVRFAFTGDQNKASMEKLFNNVAAADLEAEVVKAPHHGSHEFDFRALEAMKPVVGLVSSGDEDTFHEHIHPRATLMAALGKVMRLNIGVIFSTELAAFFHKRDFSHKRDTLDEFFKQHNKTSFTREEVRDLFVGTIDPGDPDSFYAFERTNFGIVHLRTDGERVLVFTHSGKKGMNEAYRFTVKMVNGQREVEFAADVTTR